MTTAVDEPLVSARKVEVAQEIGEEAGPEQYEEKEEGDQDDGRHRLIHGPKEQALAEGWGSKGPRTGRTGLGLL